MSSKKPRPVFVVFVVLLSFLCLVFFGSILVAMIAIPRSTPTAPPPTPTPFPVKAPPPVPAWEGNKVETICLESELSFPQISGETRYPIDETVQGILTRMGLQIVADGSACDATLKLTLSGEAFGRSYVPGGSCYTGGTVQGQMVLAADTQISLTFPISATEPAAETVWADWCRKHKEPEDYLFRELWREPLLHGLVEFWGPPAAVWMLDDDSIGNWPNPVSEELERYGPTDEIILALIYALQEESAREWAVYMLIDFAPEGEEAIPFLAQALIDEQRWEVRRRIVRALGAYNSEDAVTRLIEVLNDDDMSVRAAAREELKRITGRDY